MCRNILDCDIWPNVQQRSQVSNCNANKSAAGSSQQEGHGHFGKYQNY